MAEKEKTEKSPDSSGKKYQLPGLVPVETAHESVCRTGKLRYIATAGVLPLQDANGETEAEVFFTSYRLKDIEDTSSRPLTFVFNGGPGSSSIWLHMGALGPKRVAMEPEGWMPAPPYHLEDNMDTWLDSTDLVFIDPVETGFSRAVSDEVIDKFWGYTGDLDSVSEFIRIYLTRYRRWNSPLYLAGESYGTTRAAGLAGHLLGKGIALSGIVLISTAINLRPIFFEKGDDLPFQLFIPTYAAAAWYHRKLSERLLQMELADVVKEVSAWAESDLTVALMKGDRLSQDDRESISWKLAEYTGLDEEYVKKTDLRINIHRFCKELLRDENRSVGRLDSRFKGIEGDPIDDMPGYDPSMTAIKFPYATTFNNYLKTELGVDCDLPYRLMQHFKDRKWKWENGALPSTGEILRSAMSINPFMKVLVAQGYYDLATPSFATEYMISHMNIDSEIRKNLWITYYNAGHMFYLDETSLASFRVDVEDFLNRKVEGPPQGSPS